jgi:hypothetical protein
MQVPALRQGVRHRCAHRVAIVPDLQGRPDARVRPAGSCVTIGTSGG